jgi:DNA-directed RNA polymerase subunit M/transcription elongation factor TFIIS
MALPKIDTPVYETTLISTGKTIKYRPFLVKEQKLFLMASQSDDVKEVVNTIKQVLSNCILSEEVNVNNLPVFDLEHLFLQIRARSVSEVVNLKYTCNNDIVDEKGENKKCGGLVKVDLNLLEIKPTIDNTHSNKIQLTEKLGIMMKYPTFDIVQKLNIKNEADLLDLVVACIESIYDEEQIYYAKDVSKKELEEFVENLQQSDLEKIQHFFQTMPKLSKKFDFKCPKCGYNEDVNIEGIQSFFA